MNTTADKLELLLRTKERQKEYLQQKYPLLDFDTIPFRAYLDLFQGRSYVPGFVGGWKAYGRSNDEDADTRKSLYDYSGNGRDIELFNFAFAGMSGYGGYGQDFNNLTPNEGTGLIIEQNSTYVKIQNINSGVGQYAATMLKRLWNNIAFRLNVIGSEPNTRLIFRNADASFIKQINLSEGLNIIEPLSDTEWQQVEHIWFALSVGATVGFELLPLYPGALVSDGVDDYGQCVKDFALPDDYTVVAIRKITNGNGTGFASKGSTSGAFIFDATSDKVGANAWSYGKTTYISPMPALFSYQTKTSYNGKTITPGTAEDTEANPFYIFTHVKNGYSQAALYDLRIYDHSLTEEELQTVKDEMMSDYENATGGGIADITYVADWDAKGRSNDEEEPMRSQWTDKATGKVINLSNYSFSQMSGWNGYAEDFRNGSGSSSAERTGSTASLTLASVGNLWLWLRNTLSSDHTIRPMRVRLSGANTLSGKLRYYYIPEENPTTRYFIEMLSDGIYTLPSSVTYTGEGSHNIGFWIIGVVETDAGKTVTVEQLPLYPGALVSDGVDDHGVTNKALEESEQVGTYLAMCRFYGTPTEGEYLFYSGLTEDNIAINRSVNNIVTGRFGPTNTTILEPKDGIYTKSASPTIPNRTFLLNYSGVVNHCHSILSRLVLIREQLDDAQIEFLIWKVGKEYRGWLKEKGYDYAIDEMLNN